jgi:hypothetical protein
MASEHETAEDFAKKLAEDPGVPRSARVARHADPFPEYSAKTESAGSGEVTTDSSDVCDKLPSPRRHAFWQRLWLRFGSR